MPLRATLVGPLPPPLGGVSVHVSRLAARLTELGWGVDVVPPPGRAAVMQYYRRLHEVSARGTLIHSHLPTVLHLGLHGALAAGNRRVVYTVHSHAVARALLSLSGPRRMLSRASTSRIHAFVAVSHAIAEELAAFGVPERRLFVIPAFIAPSVAALRGEPAAPEVQELLARFPRVLCASAFRTTPHGPQLLYGEDLLVEVLGQLAPRHPQLGLVVHLGVQHEGDAARLATLQLRAEALGVARRIAWVLESRPFGPTLVRSAAMLRPTATDGDAVSVREALHCGVPALASAVAERPAGAVVVPGFNPAHWAAAVESALCAPAPAPIPQPDAVEPLLRVYEVVAGTRSLMHYVPTDALEANFRRDRFRKPEQ